MRSNVVAVEDGHESIEVFNLEDRDEVGDTVALRRRVAVCDYATWP